MEREREREASKPHGIIRIKNWFCAHVSQILNVTSLIKRTEKKIVHINTFIC